jgi:hypothetical protein
MSIENTITTGRKQAVVFIHGQGEQIPMETLTEFVDSVWITDPSVYGSTPYAEDLKLNSVWGKPDNRNKSHELRRITTGKAVNGYRTDFYSFYWADLMRGNTWQHFTGWLVGLLLRSPKRVPKNVFAVWIVLWVITLGIATLMINQIFPLFKTFGASTESFGPVGWLSGLEEHWKDLISWLVSIAAYILMRKLTLYFGDAARYTIANPNNIAARQEIRERGVSLLKSLMGVSGWDENKLRAYIRTHGEMPKWDTDYDRIIVISHSLGTIIGYDILRETFADLSKFAMPVKINGKKTKAQPKKRHEMEKYLTDGTNILNDPSGYDSGIYNQMQNECFDELRTLGSPWIISDFITLGSPLTHAEFLMTYDMDELRHKQETRNYPTCPPTLEPDNDSDACRFSYNSTYHLDGQMKLEFDHLHHAAHFAFTRWTNLYSKSKYILFGDLISGPVANHFDYAPRKTNKNSLTGIRDVQVMTTALAEFQGKKSPFFTHNKYWKWRGKKDWIIGNPVHPGVPPDHIRILRRILRLTKYKS